VTFRQAAQEWLRHAEHERALKPSSMTDYRSVFASRLLPEFGDERLVEITPRRIGQWRSRLLNEGRDGPAARTGGRLALVAPSGETCAGSCARPSAEM
jgi:hypothetical protein